MDETTHIIYFRICEKRLLERGTMYVCVLPPDMRHCHVVGSSRVHVAEVPARLEHYYYATTHLHFVLVRLLWAGSLIEAML